MSIKRVVSCDACSNVGQPAIDAREARRAHRSRGIRRVRAGRFSGRYRERVIWVDLCEFCRAHDGIGRIRRSYAETGLNYIGD